MLDVRKISWDKLSEIFLRDRLQIFTERKNEKCRLLSPLSAIPVLYIYLHFNPIWQITQSRLLLILWLEHQRIFSPHEERRGSFTTQKIRIWYYWKHCRCWESSFLSSLIIVSVYNLWDHSSSLRGRRERIGYKQLWWCILLLYSASLPPIYPDGFFQWK